MSTVAFAAIAILTLAAALAAATLQKLMHAALSFAVMFVGISAFFFLLGAEFVGLVQIFVYIGAVAVLIVFTILLTRDDVDPLAAGIFGASDEDRRKRVVQNDPTHYDNALWLANPDLKPLSSNRTSLIYDPPDGTIPPVTPDAVQRAAARRAAAGFDSYENRPLQERCIIWTHEGPPMLPPPYNDVLHIIQTPGYALVIREVETAPRLIPTDGGPHVSENIRRWNGDSRGRWEGDTLVVDTTNFTGKTAFQGSSAALHVVERFTRVGADRILYQFTMDDPNTWTRPWSAELPMIAAKGPLFEYACHEGNYGMANTLRGARVADQKTAQGAKREPPK